MTQTVIHLVDDSSPGGVTRVLEHMARSPSLGRDHRHKTHVVRRGSLSAPRLQADIIISHLSVSWSNLPMFTALRALNADVPVIHVEHSYTEAFVAGHAVPRRRFGTLMRVVYAMFDRIVAVSGPQAEWILRRGFAPRERVSTITPCADLGPFLALAPNLETVPRVYGLIGRLDTQKGFDIAIRAFCDRVRPDERLLVFGEGPERGRLEELASGDERVCFMGWASNAADAMEACDAVLMPSRWEAFGLVALEAQAAGRPLAVSTVDGMAEHIRSGAVAVGAQTADAWGDAIARLRETTHADHVLRGRMRGRAAAEQFERQWLRLFAELTTPIKPAAAA
ncbi:MAG: glycosyltransferase family 4 protein [Pseudomonadota bacterium]